VRNALVRDVAMKVGFIGLGNMGGNAAKNIIRAGFETCVFDLRRQAAEEHLVREDRP
jgi:3-hydroxyisobutyrate dehydrogenase-like beta-hydroxyacid dehydrogenase